MEEVQIWSVKGSQAMQLSSVGQAESEKLLEDVLVNTPDLLIPGLMFVGRQTPTDGGPLDLLGVDEDGRLVVFELKKGEVPREAVAQVIDYASHLDSMELTDLASHISERSGTHGIEEIDDFEDWYTSQDFVGLESLKPLRLFLVGLGADDRTERMVRFLAENSGMDISLLTFHGFDHDGETILAKQVEVVGAGDDEDELGGGGLSLKERSDLLNAQINRWEVRGLFDDVTDMLQESWPRSRQSVRKTGIRIRLPIHADSESYRGYGRVKAEKKGQVRLYLYRPAFGLGTDALRPTIAEVRFQTTPRDRDPFNDKDVKNWEFPLTADEWETNKEKLMALVQELYEAWQNRGSGE